MTRAGQRVRSFNTRCRSVDTVPSILNVACPQPSPSSMSCRPSTYRAKINRTQIQADESIRVGTPRASSPNQFSAMRNFAAAHGRVHIPQSTGPRDDLIDPRSSARLLPVVPTGAGGCSGRVPRDSLDARAALLLDEDHAGRSRRRRQARHLRRPPSCRGSARRPRSSGRAAGRSTARPERGPPPSRAKRTSPSRGT